MDGLALLELERQHSMGGKTTISQNGKKKKKKKKKKGPSLLDEQSTSTLNGFLG